MMASAAITPSPRERSSRSSPRIPRTFKPSSCSATRSNRRSRSPSGSSCSKGALGLRRDEIDRFCCHPGGTKVIDAIEAALDLGEGTLDLERQTLRDHGNMSAPTVLFVLQALLERGLPERVMMTAFGPGFTCAGLVLEK